MDEFLAENGIEYFFVEGGLLHGGEVLGVYADKFGPLKEALKQFQKETVQVEYRPYTPYKPYLVNSSGQPQPAAAGRAWARLGDGRAGLERRTRATPATSGIWSSTRSSFVPEDKSLGLRYWRISPDKADIGAKRLYEPHRAEERTRAHAAHFVPLVKDVLRAQNDPSSILCAVYDTELYGHWWFEGPQWLYHVLKQMAQDPEITLQTVGEYLDAAPGDAARDPAGRLLGRGRLPLHLAQRRNGLVVEAGLRSRGARCLRWRASTATTPTSSRRS